VGTISAYVDSDHIFVVWRLDQPVAECRGFALRRKADGGGTEETLDTWVGFAGDTAPSGTKRSSDIWPIQRFNWSDYAPPRDRALSYRAVPMVGPKDQLQPDETMQPIGAIQSP